MVVPLLVWNVYLLLTVYLAGNSRLCPSFSQHSPHLALLPKPILFSYWPVSCSIKLITTTNLQNAQKDYSTALFSYCISIRMFVNFSLILFLKGTQDVQGSKLPQIQSSWCQISRCCIRKTSKSVETAEAVESGAAAVGTRATAPVMTFLALFFISENLFLEILALKKTELG